MSPDEARTLFLDQLGPNDTLARYGEKAAVAAIMAATQTAAPQRKMQHVAYFDEGQFHWMSGIRPRDCELYAVPARELIGAFS